MTRLLSLIEHSLSYILYSSRGYDANLFIKGPAFAQFPSPTLTVDSPDVGPSGSMLRTEHTAFGSRTFPTLQWEWTKPEPPIVKEYLLIVEDPDSPLSRTPGNHGIFYKIPAEKSSISNKDLQVNDANTDSSEKKDDILRGGFKYGHNHRGSVYIAPRPLRGHGPHRYWFEVIALNAAVDLDDLSPVATREELARDIEGKVAGWGTWVGVYEAK
ncbi:hypothetical protein VTN00DRAFT_6613 [Thermoascus crustaceus]|uniref:uncharacterized protein n=1 Tax=Thermoascus crustaceus TaxID=5088 RepID=UPI003742CF03